MNKITILLALVLSGCASNLKDYSEDYETIKGTLAGPPIVEDGGNRLVLYIKTDKIVEEKDEVIVAVAENGEKEKVLKLISDKLLASPNEVIFLYGEKTEGPWREYIDGIDFEFVAIGIYNKYSNAYDVVLANYGTRTMDALKSVSWGSFLKNLTQAAVKKAL